MGIACDYNFPQKPVEQTTLKGTQITQASRQTELRFQNKINSKRQQNTKINSLCLF